MHRGTVAALHHLRTVLIRGRLHPAHPVSIALRRSVQGSCTSAQHSDPLVSPQQQCSGGLKAFACVGCRYRALAGLAIRALRLDAHLTLLYHLSRLPRGQWAPGTDNPSDVEDCLGVRMFVGLGLQGSGGLIAHHAALT